VVTESWDVIRVALRVAAILYHILKVFQVVCHIVSVMVFDHVPRAVCRCKDKFRSGVSGVCRG
jgi:hypothetical protein